MNVCPMSTISSVQLIENYQSENLKPVDLQNNQKQYILQIFKDQNDQLKEKTNELHALREDYQKSTEMLIRHADALCHSIIQKFVSIVTDSKELQTILKIKINKKEKLDIPQLIERMKIVLEDEKAPQELQDDIDLQDFVWCPRFLDILQPVLDDIETFLKQFGITDVKTQCPKMIEQAFENEIETALNLPKKGISTGRILYNGGYYALWALMYVGVSFTTPSMIALKLVAKCLLKLIF